ncbi:hypothetical protein EMIT0357P_50019 [Pseudomonas marginalis]
MKKGFSFMQEKSCICFYTQKHTQSPRTRTRNVNKMPNKILINLSALPSPHNSQLIDRLIKVTLL